MAEIALRTYLEDIERLTGREHFDEAIAHCRHILGAFPLNVDAYRLLGKALLEKSQYEDAADVFQRVLSADPSDFVSHVGLAIIREEDGVLDQAIWHMERAYELQPNNTAILDELRRLYGKRDGREPGRIGLTRTALARLYLQGELYDQAITELQSALAEDTERVDVQVMLAEIYFRDEQPAQAMSRCRAILARLPNCISANAIMAQIALANGDDASARLYLELLRALAPYQAAEIAPDNGVEEPLVERLYVQSAPPAAQPHDEGPDWVRELAASFGETRPAEAVPVAQATPPAEDELPDWLREMAALLPGTAELKPLPEAQAQLEPARPAPPPEQEAPAPEPAPPRRTSPLAEVLAATGPLISAIESSTTAQLPRRGVTDEETPDWLRQAMDEIPDFSEVEALQAAGNTSALEPWTPPSGDVPDWLRDAAAEGDDVPPAVEPPQQSPATAVPDWLSKPMQPSVEAAATLDHGDKRTTESGMSSTAAIPIDGIAETQAQSEVRQEAQMQTPTSTAVEPTNGAMAWLDQISAASEETESNGVEPAEAVMEMPVWLREPSPAQETQAAESDDLPDWLTEAMSVSPTDEAATAPVAATPAMEVQPAAPIEMPVAEAIPDEMSVADETPSEVVQSAPLDQRVEPIRAEGPEAQLVLARGHFHAGNWEEAAQLYDQLITAGAQLASIIADLEEAVGLHSTNRWYTLLGDAYSQDGQLKKAMQAYQTALKSVNTRDLATR
jgi:tetratricopeptide (TPR) repeat protein